jgi:hypothetical protein
VDQIDRIEKSEVVADGVRAIGPSIRDDPLRESITGGLLVTDERKHRPEVRQSVSDATVESVRSHAAVVGHC